ncbi:MAG: hypothetical protein DCC49_02335 [Acidobacteria bacterium]|nr:MAG: hypothetical protein DCC49_02335 [Acidobacteriota bacterium]
MDKTGRWGVIVVAIAVAAALVIAVFVGRADEPRVATGSSAGPDLTKTAEPAPRSPDATQTSQPPATGTYADLAADLAKRGFEVRPVLADGTPADPAKAAASKVISQSPPVSDQLPPGTTIEVVVDCGQGCAGDGAVQCNYPRGFTHPIASASRIRPGEGFRLSGASSPGEPMVVALLEKEGAPAASPFAKYLGAGKAKSAPTCEYDVDLVLPSNVKPGRYQIFVLLDGKTSAGPPIPIEVAG